VRLSKDEILEDAASLAKDILIPLANQEMPHEDHVNALSDLCKVLSAAHLIISTYSDSLVEEGAATVH
tara:strand:- start:707 stop:910 length:204 start_codon:yes stop_codon:yes gene_type:complete